MKAPAEKDVEQPKILVFATETTSIAARISIALASVGFRVATLTRDGHLARQLSKVQHHFAYHPHSRLKSIVRAIDRASPDLLVCTDDLAVTELQTLHGRLSASHGEAGRLISDLIQRSLAPSTSFAAMRNKSDFLTLAEREGMRCPRTIVYPANRAFSSLPAEITFPMMVKADQSEGGRCVRIVDGHADLRGAVWELQIPHTWRARRFFGAILGSQSLRRLMLPLRRTVSLQQQIVGRPANRAVICWKGKILEGISVEAVEVSHEHGPASVVRLIDHLEMATVAEHMVKRLHLSGFVGFDFVLDRDNRAWLIEMNPRVTPICHFSLPDGRNLARALYRQMKGQLAPPRDAPTGLDLIALFPNGIIRSRLTNLQSCQLDVPWEEPKLVCSVLSQELRSGILQRARSLVEHHLPALEGVLVRLGLIGVRTRTVRELIASEDDSRL